jgi:hypothetical protein
MRKELTQEVATNNSHCITFEIMQSQNVNRIFINKTRWAPLDSNATIWTIAEFSNKVTVTVSYNNLGTHLGQQISSDPDPNGAVQLVINSLDAMEHPWHFQGHEFQIVGWGQGLFGDGVTQWSLDNLTRRDTVTVPTNWHVVLRQRNDNSGIWLMYCHVAWHMEGGMLLQFAERLADFEATLRDDINSGMKALSRSFCGKDDDQAFGTQGEIKAAVVSFVTLDSNKVKLGTSCTANPNTLSVAVRVACIQQRLSAMSVGLSSLLPR